MTLLYFAHPIDYSNGALDAAITRMAANLAAEGHAVYRPGDAFLTTIGSVMQPQVQQINDFALTKCTAVFAYLPDNVRSIGTPMEIQRGLDLGLPVIVFTEGRSRSWALAGSGAHVLEKWDDALACLRSLMYANSRPVPGTTLSLWVGPKGRMPYRKHEGDAGFDLYVSSYTVLEHGVSTNVPSDVFAQFPPGMWGQIVGRSSTFHKRGLIVNTAVIDQGYRGELFASVYNPGEMVAINRGDRLAQLIPMPLLAATATLRQVDSLAESDRGQAGFGSSGL